MSLHYVILSKRIQVPGGSWTRASDLLCIVLCFGGVSAYVWERSAGVGQIDHRHLDKLDPEVGMLVVKIGGPAYRIGMGGGAASSVPSGSREGAQAADLDFNAVQVPPAVHLGCGHFPRWQAGCFQGLGQDFLTGTEIPQWCFSFASQQLATSPSHQPGAKAVVLSTGS